MCVVSLLIARSRFPLHIKQYKYKHTLYSSMVKQREMESHNTCYIAIKDHTHGNVVLFFSSLFTGMSKIVLNNILQLHCIIQTHIHKMHTHQLLDKTISRNLCIYNVKSRKQRMKFMQISNVPMYIHPLS